MLQSMGLQRIGHDFEIELNRAEAWRQGDQWEDSWVVQIGGASGCGDGIFGS